jgi:S-DNA-T family DNA segregation ATPase FtsK/SpoIIIE
MPKKQPSENGNSHGSAPKKSGGDKKEVVIKFQPVDPVLTPPEEPKRTRKMSATGRSTADRLTLSPPKGGEVMEAQSSAPAPRKRTSKTTATTGNFHKTDKLPSISPGVKQEVYGILLVVAALIFFFGLFAQKGLIADAAMAIKRLFGLASFMIPILIGAIGATYFLEGIQKREFVNQVRMLGGVLNILAFVFLLHLLDPSPKALAENGGGGGYLGYYVTQFLAGLLQNIGAFLLLVGLFFVGLIIAFNIPLREMWRGGKNIFRQVRGMPPIRYGSVAEPDDLDDAEDYSIINPRMTRSYVVNREENKLEEEALLDSLLMGHVATTGPTRPNVPPQTETHEKSYGARITPPHPEPPLPALPENKPAISQNWKREEPTGPAPAELPHKEWILPKLNMLANFSGVEVNEKDLLKKAKKIEETLASFGVEAYVREVNTGPTVTQFALEPGFGVKVARITTLSNDLALSLAAPAIRIEAPVPGQQRVGVEVPNLKIATVGMREIFESEDFTKRSGKLKIALGRDVAGQPMIADLAKMPHLLIAGATGSGKSVCINSIIAALLFQYRPDELKFIMVDPKMVELSTYNGIPHLAFPVVVQIEADPEKERENARKGGERTPTVMSVLKWTIREMEKRYKRLSHTGHRNIDSYNKVAGTPGGLEKMPYLVLIIDELADLMMVAPEEAESSICRLAQKARAVGIHLILATQRPSVDVVTGLIKANFPTRITFAMTSQTDSRVVLDVGGAEKLLGRGDMLYLPSDAPKPIRVQGVYVGDDEIDHLVNFWKEQSEFLDGAPKDFIQGQIWPQELHEIESERGEEPDETDELFEQALQIVRESRSASVSLLQRRLRIGYNRAARLISDLEQAGVIGHAEGTRPRPVLLEEEDFSGSISLTAAANTFKSEPEAPAPPPAQPQGQVQPGSRFMSNATLYRPVTPALNSQARINEQRTERDTSEFDEASYEEDDDPPL